MSFKAINAIRAVLASSRTSSERLVLIAYAMHADTAGRAWPSAATVAACTGLSERQVRRIVGALAEAEGPLEATGRRRKPVEYRVRLAALTDVKRSGHHVRLAEGGSGHGVRIGEGSDPDTMSEDPDTMSARSGHHVTRSPFGSPSDPKERERRTRATEPLEACTALLRTSTLDGDAELEDRDVEAIQAAIADGWTLPDLFLVWEWAHTSADGEAKLARSNDWADVWGSLLNRNRRSRRRKAERWDKRGRPVAVPFDSKRRDHAAEFEALRAG